MDYLKELRDYNFYCENFFKIKTKIDGIQNFKLRRYQKDFIKFVNDIKGPVRVIVLKPRQAGFSTLVASYLSHQMFTYNNFTGIALADKKSRTESIADIYKTFYNHLPHELKPMLAISNTEKFHLQNPNEKEREVHPGLDSGVLFETANDPNAGRASSRRFAHLSEAAFYRYASQIDEGIQNSIPLVGGTYIFKESTANGKAGDGKAFYDLWNAASDNESAYKPFFVPWYDVDDYIAAKESGFSLSQYEKGIKNEYKLSDENIMWRRLKLREYLSDEDLILSPEERFRQDFPICPEEAFLSTGSPVFYSEILQALTLKLRGMGYSAAVNYIPSDAYLLNTYKDKFKVFSPPRQNKKYYIGADVAEGLAQGDSSSVFVMDHEYNQVASWHGKIDADLFGHLLIDIGRFYNNALIVPEFNNMGHTTTITIRNENYPNLYKETYEDKITKDKSTRYGFRTTSKSKMDMLNELIKQLRDGALGVRDLNLVTEMGTVIRSENGNVVLNGKDRTVAACLACVGRRQNALQIRLPKSSSEVYDTFKPRKKKDDMFT